MNVRILDEHDVRRLLPMDECIEVMAAALASLARGELHNPLRFVVRPPGESSLLGLMPAHRSTPSPLYALKAVAIFPENSARGLDPHQGFVALFDGVTGETRAIMTPARSPRCAPLRCQAWPPVCSRGRVLERSQSSVPASRRPRTSMRCVPCVTSTVS